MKIITFELIYICLYLSSCSQTSKYGDPVVSPNNILKNTISWLSYERGNIVWTANYIALDSAFNIISKKEFLEKLTSGKYLPLRLNSKNSLCYQLYCIADSVNKEIGDVIRNEAQTEYQYYKMEGTILPLYNFVDINNNKYNPNTTKNKVVVFNCWFIHCKSCVEEIPRLNQLVEKYKNKKDILFVGLAFDSKKDLVAFLHHHTFSYKIVPSMQSYLMNVLNISGYPAHIIINGDGKIIKVSNNLDGIIYALDEKH